MSTPVLRPESVVQIDGDDFVVAGGELTLNSAAVPYARARIELPLLPDEIITYLDPRADVRITGTAATNSGTPRAFDLSLRGRPVRHDAKTLSLSLASDEAILQRYTALTRDVGARALEGSLRDVVNYVLDKIGAALETGADDADMTAYWRVTNLVPNPTVRGIVGNWIAGGSNGALTRQTGLVGGPVSGVTTYTRTTWTGNSGSGQGGAFAQTATVAPYVTASAFGTYTLSAWVRANVAKDVRLSVQIFANDGSVLDAGRDVDTATLVANTWTRLRGSFTLPANAARLGIFSYPQTGSQWASGNTYDTLGWMVHEGTEDVPFFDAATTDSDYTYEASGDAHVSASTRTPVIERRPELFYWEPGVSAWDFLMALTSSAGMVLWCDELRNWRLSYPESRAIGVQINVSARNASEGEDDLSIDAPDVYVSGVVVRYRWRDENGNTQEAYDSAGDPDQVLVVDLDRPYPGPGAAAAILSRRQGTGRSQNVTAVTQWQTTPGMAVQISLPGAPDTLGRVESVTFDLALSFMRVGSSGLVDVNEGDWLAVDADLDWDDVDPDLDWEDA